MKRIISTILVLIILLGMATISQATITENPAKINVGLSSKEVKVDDEITVTASWKDKMESVDLELRFDKDKLEYVSSSMSDDYIAKDKIKDGVVQISWFSMNGQGITNITYKFKAKVAGDAKFTTAEVVLADEEVNSPDSYTYGSATLAIKAKSTTTTKPTEDTTKPSGTTTTKPTEDTTKPSGTTTKPTTSTTKPSTTTKKPTSSSNSTGKKPTYINQAGVNVVNYVIYGVIAVAVIAGIVFVVKAKRK